jgi:RHS repeat-associated protein
MDNLNRLLRAKEGHWDGSTVTDGNAKRDEVWTLDQTGNWELFKRDLNGDLNYTGTNELKDRRTHNVVNELLTRDIDDNSSVNFTLVYDDNGNLTDDGEHYTYEYDAFGRLRKVKNRSTTALVSEYRYNGLGHRIGWHYDVDADGTVESNTDDPWFLFVYDDQWRIVNTYRLEEWAYDAGNPSGSEAKERFVYHQAGLGGRGGSSYIDSVMLRDRDANTGWGAASDGTMEERIYYAQNWRHDVSALITDDGRMIEWVKYSSYGVPMSLPAGDTDSDGDFDSTDTAALTGTYDVRKDVNLDGTVDVLDYLDALDLNGGLSTQGWSILSNPKWNNRKGYAGYEGDTVLAGTKWHVRHRVLESELGRWMRRDPLGYVDGVSVYSAGSQPLNSVDPFGLCQNPPCGDLSPTPPGTLDPFWYLDLYPPPPPPSGFDHDPNWPPRPQYPLLPWDLDGLALEEEFLGDFRPDDGNAFFFAAAPGASATCTMNYGIGGVGIPLATLGITVAWGGGSPCNHTTTFSQSAAFTGFVSPFVYEATYELVSAPVLRYNGPGPRGCGNIDCMVVTYNVYFTWGLTAPKAFAVMFYRRSMGSVTCWGCVKCACI